jgi:L-fucose mutarotase/ribose pyranase (RbsD/FucU family)
MERPTACIALAIGLANLAACAEPRRREDVGARIAELGHRNWVVIADAAYPRQSGAGVETIRVGGESIDWISQVLSDILSQGHVRPVVYLDAELAFVSDAEAPGIAAYRENLSRILPRATVLRMPHADLLTQVDQASRLYEVLVLKTDSRLPYSSVFLELDCGYWSSEAEDRLRDKMASP